MHGAVVAAVLVAFVAFALAAAFTLLTAHRLAASLGIAIVVTTIETLAYPRSYSYPKLLAYAIATRAMLAAAESPTGLRIALMAMVSVVAFLFRHDHGVYIGAASVVCVARLRVAPTDGGQRPGAWRCSPLQRRCFFFPGSSSFR